MDEASLASLRDPAIDGIGTSPVVQEDAPAFDRAYRLQECADIPKQKIESREGGMVEAEQVYQSFGTNGRMTRNTLTVAFDEENGEALGRPMKASGRRLCGAPSIEAIRESAVRSLAQPSEHLARLREELAYAPQIAPAFGHLAEAVDRRNERTMHQ